VYHLAVLPGMTHHVMLDYTPPLQLTALKVTNKTKINIPTQSFYKHGRENVTSEQPNPHDLIDLN